MNPETLQTTFTARTRQRCRLATSRRWLPAADCRKRVATFAIALATALIAGPLHAEVKVFDIKLGGRDTYVDVYLPAVRAGLPARGAAILAHGFTRTRQTMAGHAVRLARESVLVVAPDLPYFWHSGDNARALRDLVAALRAGAFSPPVERIVLVGFSAGALAAILAADAPGVVGYIGLDPFDRPSGIGLDAARTLRLPAYLLRAPPSSCNAYSIAAPWVKALPNLIEDRVIAEASHCDFEAPSDWICRVACGRVDPTRQQAIGEGLLDAVRTLLPMSPRD
jgi:acetyl esterase/lipase